MSGSVDFNAGFDEGRKSVQNNRVKAEIQNPFLMGLAFGGGLLVSLVILTFIIGILGHFITDAEVNQACVGHRGVRSMQDTTWGMAISGSVAVTCNDGYFKMLHV